MNSFLEPDWWYVRLYPGGLDHLDAAVGRTLPPLIDLAAEHGVDRWFFIQYTDWKGPHLRLRIRGPRDTVDLLHRRLPRLSDDLAVLADEPVPRREALVPLELRPFSGRHSGAEVGLYEAEEAKYGGTVGVELAEEVFQHSSEVALWAANLPRHPDRAALCVLLLQASAAALRVHEESSDPARFWERHLAWWTHDAGRQADTLRGHLRAAAQTDTRGIADRAAKMALEPKVQAHVGGWTDILAGYLQSASARQVPLSAGHLVFHQVHMLCNRLGILPREEALLGIMAARQRTLHAA
ncbi:lantibiotic dehydratase C-terminal domain-containing protein [Streptomyces sp. NPDC006172]|uniref:lantibiotic dehydratase C-terminal domain-containing protein n=1 Tax=Streptomyces sp. NPDC006172 TaxID=3154470 RepID=UPI0034052001